MANFVKGTALKCSRHLDYNIMILNYNVSIGNRKRERERGGKRERGRDRSQVTKLHVMSDCYFKKY